jgi:GrpB protein
MEGLISFSMICLYRSYVFPATFGLVYHIALRDHLRNHPADVEAYASLKMRLAEEFSRDIDRYVEGKTDFILSILDQYGFSVDQLASIRRANQASTESPRFRNG